LDSEVASIREHSISEAQAERNRILQDTEQELRKLQEQSQREIISAGKTARIDLQRFAAQQSVQLAEDIVRRVIRADDDTRLIELNVERMGRR
jgi:F-type H+-transporting ATPase subunit b